MILLLSCVTALGASFHIINTSPDAELSALKAILFFVILASAAILFLLGLLYNAIVSDTGGLILKYDDFLRVLLDIRDGTKYFYKEKRRSFRIKSDILAQFEDKTTGDDFLKIYDLSFEGALIKTTRAICAGDPVQLKIYLPFFSEPISAKANVTRVRPTKETKDTKTVYAAGVEYRYMSKLDTEKLIETINIINRMGRKKRSRRLGTFK
jgi:hypothetical protein